jgi:hypothetical protein
MQRAMEFFNLGRGKSPNSQTGQHEFDNADGPRKEIREPSGSSQPIQPKPGRCA